MNSVAASPMPRRRVRDLAVMALLLAVAGPAAAQQRLAGQCPLIVRKDQQILQPRPIPPAQVAGKNTMGCLSAADAIYGTV